MQGLIHVDGDWIKRWLEQANITHYICDNCHGLHISELQSREGVLDARLFVEDDGLLMTTELEVRPSMLFAVQAQLSELNLSYPSLKLFLDVNDDSMPRLVACDLLLSREGVSQAQFLHFIQATIDATAQLLEESLAAHWLIWPDQQDELTPGKAVH